MKLRRILNEYFWFILLIFPLIMTAFFIFGNMINGLDIEQISRYITSYMPLSNELYEIFTNVLAALGVGAEFSIVIAYVCYFVFLQFLRLCAEFVLLLIEITQRLIDRACSRR